MEPSDDQKLSKLLKEWQVPGAPPSLDRRVMAWRDRWWKILLTGSIRVPVPLGAALVVILLLMSVALVRKPAPSRADSTFNLVDFRPVDNPQVRIIRGQL